MKVKPTFSIARKDEDMLELLKNTDQKTLAVWACDCAERVLPYFEDNYPDDQRPRHAIDALQAWIQTGVFRMAVIRQAVACVDQFSPAHSFLLAAPVQARDLCIGETDGVHRADLVDPAKGARCQRFLGPLYRWVEQLVVSARERRAALNNRMAAANQGAVR